MEDLREHQETAYNPSIHLKQCLSKDQEQPSQRIVKLATVGGVCGVAGDIFLPVLQPPQFPPTGLSPYPRA